MRLGLGGAEGARGALRVRLSCLPGYGAHLPRPVLARTALPDWLRTMPATHPSEAAGIDVRTLKQCPPFLDAMQCGLLFPLAADLHVENGVFSWDTELLAHPLARLSRAPIGVHVPEQAAGAPFADPSRFIVKFVNHWTVALPDGVSLLVGHPMNREELPFRTLWGLVDGFADGLVHFPALWTDPSFSGTLAKGTPVAQAVPVRREALDLDIAEMDEAALERHVELADALHADPGHYRKAHRRA